MERKTSRERQAPLPVDEENARAEAPPTPKARPAGRRRALSGREDKVHGIIGQENFCTLRNTEILKTLGPRLRSEVELEPGDAARNCLDRIRRAMKYPLSGEITKKRATRK